MGKELDDAAGVGNDASGDGDRGWSDTGVETREGLADGLGEVAAEASPMVNLAFSLSSNVLRDAIRPLLMEFDLAGLLGR